MNLLFKIIDLVLEKGVKHPKVVSMLKRAGRRTAEVIPGDFAEDDIKEAIDIYSSALINEVE